MSRVSSSSNLDCPAASNRHPADGGSVVGEETIALREAYQDHGREILDRAEKISWLDAKAREAIFHALGGIDHGHLLISDAVGQKQFGRFDETGLRATLEVADSSFYRKAILGGTLAASESYLRGEWETSDLVSLIRLMARNMESVSKWESHCSAWLGPIRSLVNLASRNTRLGSRRNIAAHYDLSNEFFARVLDPTMTYSAGIFERPDMTLEEASTAKYDRICRKLDLQPGQRVLEIGTGWGGFAEHAARHYGCHVTTTTISQEQFEFARRRIAEAGLEEKVTLLKRDYRDLSGQYDRLVSIEMIEAVGHEFLDGYFRQCCRLLRPDGLMALQAITMPDDRIDKYQSRVDFIQRYIFPGGFLPAISTMANCLRKGTDFRVLHLEDFSDHYAQTLAAWRENFFAHLAEIRGLGFDERFIRMWNYYLCYCEAGFLERQIGVSQLVLARPRANHPPLLRV